MKAVPPSRLVHLRRGGRRCVGQIHKYLKLVLACLVRLLGLLGRRMPARQLRLLLRKGADMAGRRGFLVRAPKIV